MNIVVSLYRISNFLWRCKVPFLPTLITITIRILFSAVIPHSAQIGAGVVLGYGGLGIVIHARAVIGDNVVISPGVTIGGRSGEIRVPVIGENVLIGSGAKVLGAIVVGANAKIGANAVVLEDVPAGSTAVGIPARIIGGPTA